MNENYREIRKIDLAGLSALIPLLIIICWVYALFFANMQSARAAASTPAAVKAANALSPLSCRIQIYLSLSQAIKRALSNEANIIGAKHIAAEKTALKKASYAALMPDISIAGGGIWTQARQGSPLFASANGMRELIGQARLTVPIFEPKSYAAIALAKSNLNIAGYRLQNARLFVAARVAQYFYGIILLKDEVKIKQKALDGVKKILAATKNEYKAGNLPRFDVVQTGLMAEKLQTDLNVLKSKLKALEHVFAMEIFYSGGNISINAPELSPVLPAPSADFNRKLPPVNRLILNAVKMQPLLKIARAEIKSARAGVKVNKAEKLPSVQGGAAYGEDTVNSVDASGLGWQFFVMLNIPVSNFGLNNDYIEAAAERLMAVKSAESAIKLSIKKRLARDYGLAKASKKELSGAKILVKKSKEVFKMTEEGYLAGAFNALTLQEAQNNWIKARLGLAEAINRLYLTIAQLDIDMGIIPSGDGKL
ncbi:MAG: TolC family protein [bacterium]